MNNKENSRKILRFLAGLYLIHLAIQLYKGIFTEMQDTTFRVLFFLFATLFLAIGALLMFFVIRAEIRKAKGTDQEDPATLEDHTESDSETTDSEE